MSTNDQIVREAAESIDQLQQDGELGVSSLSKIIQTAIDKGIQSFLTERYTNAGCLKATLNNLTKES